MLTGTQTHRRERERALQWPLINRNYLIIAFISKNTLLLCTLREDQVWIGGRPYNSSTWTWTTNHGWESLDSRSISLISSSMWQPDHPQSFDPAQAAKFVPSGGYITENLEVTPMSFLCVFPDYNSKSTNIITYFIGLHS